MPDSLITRRRLSLMLLAAGTTAGCALPGPRIAPAAESPVLTFDPRRFERRDYRVGATTVTVRAYEGLPVVARPVEPAYQALNLYIPEAYFNGGTVGRYHAHTAPIFLPNQVGGYMPALPGQPDKAMGPPLPAGQVAPPTAMAVALSRGLIVASPGARGRTLQATDGRYTGKAPAAIVDLKAAVRWLRRNAGRMPGNVERIVSNGTSAGGALSSLLGASGNHPDYEAELQALGAAPGRDDIFAASAYCPIANLEHADAAYEWQFQGLREYRNVSISMLDFKVQRQEVVARLTAEDEVMSRELRDQFVAYVNTLALRDADGRAMQLGADGRGSLQEHIVGLLRASAQRFIDGGQTLNDRPWLTVEGGRVNGLSFDGYVRAAGRMKALPAFDGLSLETGENQLFGDAQTDKRHFTDFSASRSRVAGAGRSDERSVRLMNPMAMASDGRAQVSRHWRIRQGTMDRDTSLAIPVLLGAAVRRRGATVDLALPWDRPHSGDYDLDELFAWIDALPPAA